MKLVIELDDDLVNGIKEIDMEHARLAVRSFQATIADTIKNGKPLPTDTVDRVTIKEYLESFGKDTNKKEPCEDCISRQAVIDCFKKWQPYMATRLFDFEKELSALPPVTPQPKMGRWKRISMDKYSEHAKYWYRCDRCGKDNLGNTDYCPNCGQPKMQEVKDERTVHE